MKIIEGFKLREVMGQLTLVGEGIGQIDFNKLVLFNASTTWLWQSVEGKEFTVEKLATLLSEHYGINKDTALNDASDIAKEWIKNELVEE